MDSNERLRSGLAAVANTGLGFAQRKYQIEARTQFEDASTNIAGEIDRFNMELDRDPDYQSYQEKWAKKQQDLQKYIGGVKNPEAKRELESFLKRTYESQTTVLEGKTAKALLQDTYVTRTNALNNRLEQTAIPTADKMLDIDATVDGLLQDGVVDRVKAQDMKSALASATIGQDLIGRALALYREVEAEQGPESAISAANRYVLDFQEIYTVGGQTASATIAQKNGAQAAIRDAYTETKRMAKATWEKQFNETDVEMTDAYFNLVQGKPGALNLTMISNANYPKDTDGNNRKIHWETQLKQYENLQKRGKDSLLEAEAELGFLQSSMIVNELKRAGNALSGEVTVKIGSDSITVRGAKGVEDFIKSKAMLWTTVYGATKATSMIQGLLSGIDKPTGVLDAARDRILSKTKDKNNPIPEWEANQHLLRLDELAKEKGGSISLEEVDEYIKTAVDRPQLKRLVKEIGQSAFMADDDDHITRMIWNIDGQGPNEFRYDVSDGRFINPRTKAALDSYQAALKRLYEKAEGIKTGEYSETIKNTTMEGAVPYFWRDTGAGRESTTGVVFGSNRATALLKVTEKNGAIVSALAFDEKQNKWRPAIRRRDNPKIWDWAPEVKAEDETKKAEEARAAREALERNYGYGRGVSVPSNPRTGAIR